MSEDNKGSVPDMPEEMGTLFIMDLLRQKREKALREQKDQMILKMAMEQKKKMEQKKSSSTSFTGGFMGVGALTKGTGPKWTPSRRRKQPEESSEHPSVQSDNEMFILGLLKEQRQEIRDRESQEVIEQSLECASNENYMKKFER